MASSCAGAAVKVGLVVRVRLRWGSSESSLVKVVPIEEFDRGVSLCRPELACLTKDGPPETCRLKGPKRRPPWNICPKPAVEYLQGHRMLRTGHATVDLRTLEACTYPRPSSYWPSSGASGLASPAAQNPIADLSSEAAPTAFVRNRSHPQADLNATSANLPSSHRGGPDDVKTSLVPRCQQLGPTAAASSPLHPSRFCRAWPVRCDGFC